MSKASTETKQRNSKVRFSRIEDIVNFVLEPGDESELSELDDQSETDGEELLDNDKSYESNDDSEDDSINNDTQNKHDVNDEITGETDKEKSQTKKIHKWRWRAKDPPISDHTFKGEMFSPPPENIDIMVPIDYFKIFWTNDITKLIVQQTNLYSVQKDGKSILTNELEIEQFLGMHMLMGIIKLPDFKMYWASETRYPKISDVMSLKRFQMLRKYIHVVDNNEKGKDENKNDKLFKIRPILEMVRDNCIKTQPEPVHSIDEQIIPAKTRRSGIRQYNPQKPKKWGFKMFVRAGQSGFMYDFFLYSGKHNGKSCSAEDVTLRLAEGIPRNCNFKLCFDNWFSTLSLCLELKKLGILTTATIRANRLAGCPLESEKDLKKRGRGSSSYRTDNNSGIMILRWFDNKCVQVVSTYSSPQSTSTVKRWDGTQKTHVDVSCPEIVKEYNSAMGGVDLADMLIALYRTPMKTKRWYVKVLFHCIDICKVNAWLLYRRYASQSSIPKNKQHSLQKFSSMIANALMYQNKPVDRPVGRPPKRKSLEEDDDTVKRGRTAVTPTPQKCVRNDEIGHWPVFRDKKNKCRHCKKGIIRTSCMKCDIHLCFTGERNCFYEFHQT